jgi:5-oxoprolinase (ATP-hydrolysing)
VLIDNWKLCDAGVYREAETRALLGSGRWPARNIEQNLADLRAQLAGNAKGAEELGKMVAHFGLPVVQAYMQHVQDNAEEAVRPVIDALSDGSCRYELDPIEGGDRRLARVPATLPRVLLASAAARRARELIDATKNDPRGAVNTAWVFVVALGYTEDVPVQALVKWQSPY